MPEPRPVAVSNPPNPAPRIRIFFTRISFLSRRDCLRQSSRLPGAARERVARKTTLQGRRRLAAPTSNSYLTTGVPQPSYSPPIDRAILSKSARMPSSVASLGTILVASRVLGLTMLQSLEIHRHEVAVSWNATRLEASDAERRKSRGWREWRSFTPQVQERSRQGRKGHGDSCCGKGTPRLGFVQVLAGEEHYLTVVELQIIVTPLILKLLDLDRIDQLEQLNLGFAIGKIQCETPASPAQKWMAPHPDDDGNRHRRCHNACKDLVLFQDWLPSLEQEHGQEYQHKYEQSAGHVVADRLVRPQDLHQRPALLGSERAACRCWHVS